jgi:hypothetical protein
MINYIGNRITIRVSHRFLSESDPQGSYRCRESHFEKLPRYHHRKERDFLQMHRPKETLTLAGEEILKAEIKKRKTYYTASQVLFE